MKILVLINEDLENMVLGKNTTLSYILGAVDLGHDVYVHKISADGEMFLAQNSFAAFWFNKSNASLIVEKYKEENQKIVNVLLGQQNQSFAEVNVADFCALRGWVFEQKNIFLHEIDFVVQRLEPMKAPFPPVGRISINNYLTQLKKLFPQKFTFNFLVEAYQDKEFPLVLAKKYEDLATPTSISFYGDLEMPKKVQEMGKKYSEIFKTGAQKIVLKPDDSAQALGVFAVEISAAGLNLEQIKNKTIAQLSEVQLYEINSGALSSDIIEIINILCFVQFCKTKFVADQRLIADIAPQEIAQAINSLYGKKILMQPFLEGVRLGDIRINLAKMSDGNFKVVGAVFRHSIAHDEKNFTTCLTIGASRAQAIELDASAAEQKNLAQKINYILQQLNGDEALKTKYRDVLEIGCDFLLVGNQRDVFFGEANHHCPALMPLSESLEAAKKAPSFYEEINGLKVPYDGGLAVAKAIISQQIKLQN